MNPISACIDQLNRFTGQPKASSLHEHIHQTYFSLRFGIAALSFLLPGVLWVWGMIKGLSLQESMSAYYHASGGAMRDVFVGVLCAIALGLYAYKGFSRQENVFLNVAGAALACVALFPMQWDCADGCSKLSAHNFFTIVFFCLIGYVCFFRSSDTLNLISNQADARRYALIYKAIGVLLWSSLILGLALYFMDASGTYVFFLETIYVWIFASYWFVKTSEIMRTGADQSAGEGKLRWSNGAVEAMEPSAKKS